jgi:hypothetical protein
MPFTYEGDTLVVVTPCRYRCGLMTSISPIKQEPQSSIGWQRNRAVDNLNMWSSVASEEDASSFAAALGLPRELRNLLHDRVFNENELGMVDR